LIEAVGVDVLLAEHKLQPKNLIPAFVFRHIKELYPICRAKLKEPSSAEKHQAESERGDVGNACCIDDND